MASPGEATGLGCALPELASVYWRPRASDASLTRSGRLWTLSTVAHTVPFVAAALLLTAVKPITTPVALILLAHAWIIPELYASRGAGVLRQAAKSGTEPEQRSLLLLGDLLDTAARERQVATGLALERGRLGVWLVGEAGALLVRPGGRRVCCYCVKATDATLPSGDKIAHLLLALRTDETGFATVANLAYSGAVWRLRRRLEPAQRTALRAAADAARAVCASKAAPSIRAGEYSAAPAAPNAPAPKVPAARPSGW